MTEQEFKNCKNLNGIILFVSEHCSICSKEKELFQKCNIKFDTIVCDNDPNYFIESHKIDVLPEVRIYENNNVVWNKIDLVSEADLDVLRSYI